MLLLLVAGAVFAGVRYRARLGRAWTALTSSAPASSTSTVAGEPAASPASAPAPPCWSPAASLGGRALDISRQAKFETIEQLSRPGTRTAPAYSVPARLISYRIASDRSYLLVLQSLVHPNRTIQARIPDGRCVANADDSALFSELREDISLRFGPAGPRTITLSPPVSVIVTGLVPATGPLELAPVINFQVQ